MSKISLVITLDHRLARNLGSSSCANFVGDQTERFALMDLDGVDDVDPYDMAPLLSEVFVGGVMTWLRSLSEALILRAYEQAAGFQTAVLTDEAVGGVPLDGPGGGYEDCYVILSSRSFHHSWMSHPG